MELILKDRFKFRACFRLWLRAALEEVLVGFSQRAKKVEVVHASAEDDAPETTKKRWSAQEKVGGTSPIVPEWPVVAVVGEKSFQ